ncbi:hypothetical protein KAH94_03825 [bacterium]|nr:hypothetical protein [bacterium]
MNHVPSQKYNVAWFNLSECVIRGERERALGVYKLLSHSIDDPAFALQLEGDLLAAFEDKLAIEKYREAAQLYKDGQRFFESAAIYEHLIVLQPDVESYVVQIVSLYKILNFSEKIFYHLQQAINRFSGSSDKKKLNSFLSKLQESNSQLHDLACQLIKE